MLVHCTQSMLEDLRVDPRPLLEGPSARGLWLLLSGYAAAVPAFNEVLVAVTERLSATLGTTLTLSAGSMVYLTRGDGVEGHAALWNLVHGAVETWTPEDMPPLQRSIVPLLPVLARRAPMLIGSWDVRDVWVFVQGFHRGLQDQGYDVGHDLELLAQLERALTELLGFPARWDRALFALTATGERSAAEFAERMLALQAASP